MRHNTKRTLVRYLIPACLVLVAVPLWACSVPVFRYALERWTADPYLVVVFHRGELTEAQQTQIARMGPKGGTAENSANLKVKAVDLDADPVDKDMLELWKLEKTETTPWMTAHYPAQMPPAWSGSFTKEAVDGLIDSPVRREVARRILKGDTAVWVLLESGNKKQDDAAFTLLSEQIKHQQETLKLPEIDPDDVAQGLVSEDALDMKIAFSAIRFSRSDSKEKMFVDMLLGSEGGGELSLRADDIQDKPMAFPLFGRGRVLYGLIGGGINKDTIADACQLLIGPCTCQVKGDNPGMDIVMAIDWDKMVEPQVEIDKALPPLAGLGGFGAAPANSETIAAVDGSEAAVATDEHTHEASSEADSHPTGNDVSTSSHGTEPPGVSSIFKNSLMLGGLLVVFVIGASLFLMRKS